MKDVFPIVENNEEQSHSTDRVEEKTKGTQKKHKRSIGLGRAFLFLFWSS